MSKYRPRRSGKGNWKALRAAKRFSNAFKPKTEPTQGKRKKKKKHLRKPKLLSAEKTDKKGLKTKLKPIKHRRMSTGAIGINVTSDSTRKCGSPVQ